MARGCLDPCREQQCRGAVVGRRRVTRGVERGQQALRAAGIAEDDPGPAEPVGDAQRAARVVDGAPGQRGVEVGPLGAGEGQVLGLPRAAHARRRGRRPRGVPGGVRGAPAVGPPGLGQCVEREGADAVEQSVARGVVDDDQRAAREPRAHVDRRRARHVERLEHGFHRGKRCAAGERRERPQAALVVGEEQVVAPSDRGLQRPPALRPAARRVGQDGEAVVEAAGDVLDRERPRARGGELDRQRQPVERPA
jgi:hypothetical protein